MERAKSCKRNGDCTQKQRRRNKIKEVDPHVSLIQQKANKLSNHPRLARHEAAVVEETLQFEYTTDSDIKLEKQEIKTSKTPLLYC